MTLGEIKIEALKLMFAGFETELTAQNLEQYGFDSDNYRMYLSGMPGAINRCFSRLEDLMVLPSRSARLDRADASVTPAFLRFDLSALLPDFYDVDRVILENEDGVYNGNCEFMREGNVIVLGNDEDAVYTLLYKPSIKRLSQHADNSQELPLPEGIASLIPYFIKGDLFREDEPAEAAEARNWFESQIQTYVLRSEGHPERVKTVYAQ